MNVKTTPDFTALSNTAISNALGLESLVIAFIEEQKPDFLESAHCIAAEQVTIISQLREHSSPETAIAAVSLSARTIAVNVMLKTLSQELDDCVKVSNQSELPEAILTMIKSCSSLIKTIKYS